MASHMGWCSRTRKEIAFSDFDNSHLPDGGEDGQPFDHEHRGKDVARALPYSFRSAALLKADFFLRIRGALCPERAAF